MSLQVNIDGRPVDSLLTPADLEKGHKDEKNDFIVEDHIASHKDGYVHLGELAPQRDPVTGELRIMATEDHMKSDVDAAKLRHQQNRPVIPVWYFEDEYGETHWFLNYDDAQMAQQGYICFDVEHGTGCLARQKDHTTPYCDPISGPPCGRRTHTS